MLTRPTFYDNIRPLFGGELTTKQVQGMDAILNAWSASGCTDPRWLAYILATVYWETAHKMQPVKEYGGEAYLRSKPYYPYYGRDLVHTTWEANYQKVKDFTGVDVVTYPDLIADLPTASRVAITFMIKGWYTGKKLAHYFNDTKTDWVNARRIINGTDRAKEIAGVAQQFYAALVTVST
jgi:putative chitinase